MRHAFVYLISNKSHTLYCGMAADLRARFEEHLNGTYPNGFTARCHFDRLVWFEVLPDAAAAAKREQQNQEMATQKESRVDSGEQSQLA